MPLTTPDDTSPATGRPDQPLSYGSTWSGAYAQTVLAYPYTGDYRIDTLLEGAPGETGLGALVYRWNASAPLSSPVQVTYSFMTAEPGYGGTNEGTDVGFQPFDDRQKAAVRQIMGELSQELGITLEEVGDSASSQIRFGNNYQENSTGYSWLPNSAGERSGDVWIDVSPETAGYPVNPNLRDLSKGTAGYDTLLHEIGHALGLKHPGDYNAGSGASTQPGNYLGTTEDNETYTVMSYTQAPAGQQREWYGLYDLMALKLLYGSRSYNAGDTTYTYNDASGRALKIIDDSSGTDTIDISGLSSASSRVVDMRPGGLSSVGLTPAGNPAVQNLSIDYYTVLEKFVGTPYGDTVTGNQANNLFVLGTGANVVTDGGGGIDLVQYTGNRGNYEVAASGSTIRVNGTNVADTLTTGVERLAFDDQKLAFDLDGHAGTTAKLLGVLLGNVARADLVGAGLWALDAGASYLDLMNVALNARLGAGRSNAEVVDLIFTNVVDVKPSAEQAAPYIQMLESGSQSQASLAILAAETTFNADNIGLVGLAQSGLIYV